MDGGSYGACKRRVVMRLQSVSNIASLRLSRITPKSMEIWHDTSDLGLVKTGDLLTVQASPAIKALPAISKYKDSTETLQRLERGGTTGFTRQKGAERV